MSINPSGAGVIGLVVVWSFAACVPPTTVRNDPAAGDAASAVDAGDRADVKGRFDATIDAPGADRALPVDAPEVGASDVPVDSSEVDAPADVVAADSGECGAGSSRCGASCVDPATDVRHCGGCGVDCGALPHVNGAAAVRCVAGACVLGAGGCEEGWGHCSERAGDGCETRLATVDHCGGCGQRCAGDTPVCNAAAAPAVCASGCGATQTRCGASCVDAQRDIAHCGACGRSCPVVLNARSVCVSGACGFECVGGYHRCGDRCADDTAAVSCGGSCVSCLAPAGAAATCVAGACGFVCPPGQHRCGERCADSTSILTCGTACAACAVPTNGSATCDGVACAVVCDAGYARSGGGCVAIVAPRALAPLSTARVTSRRPLLSWVLAPGTDGTRVELCRQRACTTVALSFDATGGSGTPGRELEPGVWFWRLRGRAGGATGATPGATWQFEVGARSAPAGRSWGTTADFNGDGYADVVVSAPGANSGAGRVHIYRGSATGIAATPSTSLNGPEGPSGGFGYSVASAGDVNGDGYADLVVGSQHTVTGDGTVYVYLGSAVGVPVTPSIVINGPDRWNGRNGSFGRSVSSAGDINADGYADVVVGAYRANNDVGRVYVYFGGLVGTPATPTAVLDGPDVGGYFGQSLATGADFNGDGFSDIVVSAPVANAIAGRVHVYAGSARGLSVSPVISLTGTGGAGSLFGNSTMGTGDVNGDGYADIVVGEPGATLGAGRAYVHRGSPTGLSVTPVIVIRDPVVSGSSFGISVASAGDLNGDGCADIIVGEHGVGLVHMFLGSPGLISESPMVSVGGSRVPDECFGCSVASAGDVNGDGFSDAVMGEAESGTDAGRSYVFHSTITGLPQNPFIVLSGPDGARSRFGARVAN